MSDGVRSNIIRFPTPVGGDRALLLRVELLLVTPAVWRRLLVPERATFWDLHVAIQDAFGWGDRHLHQFTVDDPHGGPTRRFGIPDDSGINRAEDVLADWEHRPARYLRRDAPEALYVYDFAEEWQHAVELEDVITGEDLLALPRCLDGAGRTPREDGGRVAGQDKDFAPDGIEFSDPRRRWLRTFGHD